MEVSSLTGSPQVEVVARDEIGFAGLTSNEFLELLVTELQNQDPLEPMTNDQIVGQLSSMRELESNLALKNTLTSLVGQQQLGVASGLIGRAVEGLTADNQPVTGVVERVFVEGDDVVLGLGEESLPLQNVTQVQSA